MTLKVFLSLCDRYKTFTKDWLWIEICENVVLSKIEFKTLTILTLKCTSHEYMNLHNVKTVNVAARIFDRFVGKVCLEISRR